MYKAVFNPAECMPMKNRENHLRKIDMVQLVEADNVNYSGSSPSLLDGDTLVQENSQEFGVGRSKTRLRQGGSLSAFDNGCGHPCCAYCWPTCRQHLRTRHGRHSGCPGLGELSLETAATQTLHFSLMECSRDQELPYGSHHG